MGGYGWVVNIILPDLSTISLITLGALSAPRWVLPSGFVYEK